MGLADRDYMRDRHRREQAAYRPIDLRGPAPPSGWLLKFVVIVGAVAVGWWLAMHYQEARQAQPFPLTGEVMWFVEKPTAAVSAGLTIAAPPDRNRNFAVKLSEWASGRPVAVVPIRAGETANVQVPLGEFRITIASGTRWQGSAAMFGGSGDVREAVDPMRFYKTDRETMGHQIDLRLRLNGNLQTRPTGKF